MLTRASRACLGHTNWRTPCGDLFRSLGESNYNLHGGLDEITLMEMRKDQAQASVTLPSDTGNEHNYTRLFVTFNNVCNFTEIVYLESDTFAIGLGLVHYDTLLLNTHVLDCQPLILILDGIISHHSYETSPGPAFLYTAESRNPLAFKQPTSQ